MGGLIAKGNDNSPMLGAIQAIMVEGVANTPFANSLAGGTALAATYGWMIADLAQLDQALAEKPGISTLPTQEPTWETPAVGGLTREQCEAQGGVYIETLFSALGIGTGACKFP